MNIKTKYTKLEEYPNYLIYNDGRVYSLLRNKFLKPSSQPRGYYVYRLKTKNGQFKTKDAHRLIAQAFLTDYSDALQVNHINGNKHDNNITNLEMVTASENMIHAKQTGLLKKQSHAKKVLAAPNRYKVLVTKNKIKQQFESLNEAFKHIGYTQVPATYYYKIKNQKPLIFHGYKITIIN